MSRVLGVACIIVLGALIFLFSLGSFDKSDENAYRALERSSTRASQKSASNISYCEQKRTHVTKNFWLQKNEPLQMKIRSACSSLYFFGETEVVEEMQEVFCTLQEELFYRLPDGKEVKRNENGVVVFRNGSPVRTDEALIPMQRFRALQAKTALYNYKTQLFVANDVKLWKYETTGHDLPSSEGLEPLMTGAAKTVEIQMKGEDFAIEAHQFKTMFEPKAGAL